MSVIYCEKCCRYVDTDYYEVECTQEGHELL